MKSKRWYVGLAALIVGLAIVIPLGIVSAVHQGQRSVNYNPFGGTAPPTGSYPNASAFCRGLPPTGLVGMVTTHTLAGLEMLRVEVVTSPTPQIRSGMDSLYRDVLHHNIVAAKTVAASITAQLGPVCGQGGTA